MFLFQMFQVLCQGGCFKRSSSEWLRTSPGGPEDIHTIKGYDTSPLPGLTRWLRSSHFQPSLFKQKIKKNCLVSGTRN